MINAKNENGKFSIAITLVNKNKSITADFYLDTGFDGYLKIDKHLFDELELQSTKKKKISLASGAVDNADVSKVKFKVDEAEGEAEIIAVGWGGRNLLGTNFLRIADIILVIDNSHGMYLTNNRNLAYEVGKTIFMWHNKIKS